MEEHIHTSSGTDHTPSADNTENAPVDSSADVYEMLAESRRQAQEYLQGWQRAKADFSNYKRDETARMEDVARYAGSDLIRDMITVLDSFDLAIGSLEKQGPVEKGVYMIRTQIEDVLKKRGLQRIEIAPGSAYDPALAEAIAQTESDQYESGSVVDVIEQGYRLHDKVIRPARVRIVS
jgi:molecular chaperone GrpE